MQPPTKPSCRQCRRRLVFWSVSRQLRMLLRVCFFHLNKYKRRCGTSVVYCLHFQRPTVVLTVFGEGTRKRLAISYVLLFLRKNEMHVPCLFVIIAVLLENCFNHAGIAHNFWPSLLSTLTVKASQQQCCIRLGIQRIGRF